MLSVGTMLYMLMHHLAEYDDLGADLWAVLGGKCADGSMDARAFFARQHGSVEIVNQDGDLERVHFWIPDFCLLLSDEKKDELLYSVDR
jgi:hypothetical protein